MNQRTRGIIFHSNNYKAVDIFGYATKGIPGVEILGLNRLGRTLKEKIIFLTRNQGIKLPFLRYVICVDEHQVSFSRNVFEFGCFLELPILILFWSLSGNIPISRLKNCFSSGSVGINGKISLLNYDSKLEEFLQNEFLKNDRVIWIGSENCQERSGIQHLKLDLLLSEYCGIQVVDQLNS